MHAFTFSNGRTFTPDGPIDLAPAEVAAHNAAVTAAEVAHWRTAPDRFAPAYFSFDPEPTGGQYRRSFRIAGRGKVTTWNGADLGVITSAHVYGHNFGGRMIAIRVRGNNGADYHGRASWDGGNVIRLRKVKG